jgi:hypothetical protein
LRKKKSNQKKNDTDLILEVMLMQTIRTADLGENMVIMIMTEEEADALLKMRRNNNYLAKLDRGTEAIINKDLIHVSLDEMKAMEDQA